MHKKFFLRQQFLVITQNFLILPNFFHRSSKILLFPNIPCRCPKNFDFAQIFITWEPIAPLKLRLCAKLTKKNNVSIFEKGVFSVRSSFGGVNRVVEEAVSAINRLASFSQPEIQFQYGSAEKRICIGIFFYLIQWLSLIYTKRIFYKFKNIQSFSMQKSKNPCYNSLHFLKN